ncbi:hypothetical protein WOLCODRAFT_137228 [Wolfiporia cocos MD-104 SS10]|uniref:Uncharacterized protein n=1 Tax=Wolfiporia cocos (strain MD-104) TaxID=742152 RepID=A0A2H3JWR6_WOLCO|nr:hypothetical protein WOLCODRAFT_137228 [Wolfiporia cocos MD-104 SS10]
MASFSRLQLAAALIEYDNDDSDPTQPRRSAHDSAIFAHLRRNDPPRRHQASRSTDYLGIALPSETGSVTGRESMHGGRESIMDGRRSRGSIDVLRNPFSRDSTYGTLEGFMGEDDEEEMEVDLTSWGLDSLLPKDKEKDSKNSRNRKVQSEILPNPHPDSLAAHHPGPQAEPGPRGARAVRTMSMGNFDDFGEGGAFLEAKSTVLPSLGGRRHSIGTPLDAPAPKTPVHERPKRGRTASSHALIEGLPITPPLHSIPFPTSESVRSVSPVALEGTFSSRPPSRGPEAALSPSHAHTDSADQELPNPFAVRPLSPDRASRFDPKAARGRTTSYGSLGTMLSPGIAEEPAEPPAEEPNPFALRPPSPSRTSRFDPKARARTASVASLGTQMMLDNDARSAYGLDAPQQHQHQEEPVRGRRYSRLDLMRPKVLIMPSPLQSAGASANTSNQIRATDGFELHPSDGAPLPPGARASRRSSATLSVLGTPGLVASNSFTPNPRADMSLAQLTFRNTLAVDGQRDPSYADIEQHLRRATQDGEQIDVEPAPEPAAPMPVPALTFDPAERSKRPVGKLYGKSLIDDLEERKAAMRSKQRVFAGDHRPSMMARTPMQRSSTLIDPESLKQRPTSQRLDSFRSQPDLSRRNSATLLNFDEEVPGAPRGLRGADAVNAGNKRSVFGVDTLWERELVKLREMEERERLEAEEARRLEALEVPGKKGKSKGKKKGKRAEPSPSNPLPESASQPVSEPASELQPPPSPPHVLPPIERTTGRRRGPPPPVDDNTPEDSESDDDAPILNRRTIMKDAEADEWVAGSSDEEERGRQRTTRPAPRSASANPIAAPRIVPQNDDSSDEDVPLVATIGRAAQRQVLSAGANDDSDEERPLSALLDKTKLTLPPVSLGESLLPGGSVKNDGDDEDDKPLGLRVSRAFTASQAISSAGQDADDDQPLAFHPDQMRRTQYMMAQQQQQQMMMQAQAAQLHQSMIFTAPSMMASGFFGPPMPPPMMMIPQIPGTPPPMHDAAKFGRVDKWRHDVAVEGAEA